MRWPIGKVKKYRKNPVLNPYRSNKFESAATYNGTALKENNKVYLYYRAEQHYYNDYISSIGMAVSKNGLEFERKKEPVIKPERRYEKRGCEDPRITKIEDTYYLIYVAFTGRKSHIALAESKDLLHWKKKGLLMKYAKSGVLLPKKIKGKYYLYYGDTNIYLATSRNLKDWQTQEKPVLTPRRDHFDSRLVEMGPAPIITKKGIFVIYNSFNGEEYSAGCAMLDKNDPGKAIARKEDPILSPTSSWESYGKINYVVFAEGLVQMKNKYFIYYGGADKSIGVAFAKKKY